MTPYRMLKFTSELNILYNLQAYQIMWVIIESAISVLKGFAVVFFVEEFLGSKSQGRFWRRVNIAFSLIYAAVLALEYYLCGLFEYKGLLISFIPITAILIAYAFLYCGGKTAAKIAVTLAANAVTLLVTGLSNVLTVELVGKTAENKMLLKNIEVSWAVFFTAPVLIYFIFYVILRLFNKTDISGKRSIVQWTLVSVALTFSVASVLMLFTEYAYDYRSRLKIAIFASIAVFCFVLSDIFVLLLITDILKKNKAVNELELLRQTEEYNRQYMSHLQSEYETVRKLRHDSKNSLLALSALISRGDTKRAQEQINEYLGVLNGSEVFIETDNTVVNAVANAKLTAAKSDGIECECLVCRDIVGISDADLCRLLSNMLDNAVTACNNDPSSKRRIELKIIRSGEGYDISVKNTVREPVLESNPELLSTKENPAEHGCGVKIIREIAAKYDGRSDFYDQDGMFCCAVYLRTKKDG